MHVTVFYFFPSEIQVFLQLPGVTDVELNRYDEKLSPAFVKQLGVANGHGPHSRQKDQPGKATKIKREMMKKLLKQVTS
jgi:hypothetical protein